MTAGACVGDAGRLNAVGESTLRTRTVPRSARQHKRGPLGWAIGPLLAGRPGAVRRARALCRGVAAELDQAARFVYAHKEAAPRRRGSAGSRLSRVPLHAEAFKTARRRWALYLVLCELADSKHVVWGRRAWQGFERAGAGPGLKGRLRGVCTKTLQRDLSALERAGLISVYQPPPGTPVLQGPNAEHCYNVIRVLRMPDGVQKARAMWFGRKHARATKRASASSTSTPRKPQGSMHAWFASFIPPD